jgi:hypothetical protein
MKARQRWLLWLAFLGLWTTALLVPVPRLGLTFGGLGVDSKDVLAKAVHVMAYAAFAVLTGWLRVPVRLRWLPLFFVTAHGTLTELLQQLTLTRTGSLTDVGWDNLGVALGLLASWKWWSAGEAPERMPGRDGPGEGGNG